MTSGVASTFLVLVVSIVGLVLGASATAFAGDGCAIKSPILVDRIHGQSADLIVEDMPLDRLIVRDSKRPKKRRLSLEGTLPLSDVHGATMTTGDAALIVVNPSTCQQAIWHLPASGWVIVNRQDSGHDVLVYRDADGANGPVIGADIDLTTGKLVLSANGARMDYALRGQPAQGKVSTLFVTVDRAHTQYILFGACSAPKVDHPRKGRYVARGKAEQCPPITLTDIYTPWLN